MNLWIIKNKSLKNKRCRISFEFDKVLLTGDKNKSRQISMQYYLFYEKNYDLLLKCCKFSALQNFILENC